MNADEAPAYAPPEVVAGIDLGSNSFHMIVVRSEGDGRIHVLDRIRETVRLAAGLGEDNLLDADAQQRGLEALERFAQRLASLPPAHVRAVGTNTLRKAKNGPAFVNRARKVLGHDIDIISGPEEARLIYLGVAHASYFEGRRLVMDIGGGSTELILGQGFETETRHSFYMGCVSFSKRFFSKGKLTSRAFEQAILAAKRELTSVEQEFRRIGWTRATGASGTLKSVGAVLAEAGWSPAGITRGGLDQLIATLIDQRRIEKIALPGLEEDRAEIFPGGVAIVKAAFDILQIEAMEVSDGALREGVAYELLGRSTRGDIRDVTARTFAERYRADPAHAERVESTAIALLDQLRTPWRLPDYRSRKFLHWAAQLHEIGLSIAYAGHHKHAAYLVEHAEMPGFSRAQQAMLAAMLRNQRRRIRTKSLERLPPDRAALAPLLTVILRLAILLNRGRERAVEVEVTRATKHHLALRFPAGWLETHPLTAADLEEEAEHLRRLDLELAFG